MFDTQVIVRDVLLNTAQQLIGYQFFWREPALTPSDLLLEARDVLGWISQLLDPHEEGAEEPFKFGYRCYLYAPAEMLRESAFVSFPPQALGLIVSTETLSDPQTCQVVQTMRKAGYEFVLRGADLAVLRPEILEICQMVEVQFEAGNFTAQARIYALLKKLSLSMVANQVFSWSEYAICHKLGLNVFAGHFFLEPPPGEEQSKTIPSSQSALLRLMEAVHADADISKLEELIKYDIGVSYRLLHYIHSASFGLRCEIKSLRHVIQLLGYKPLYRWLAVLLATSDPERHSTALLQAAFTRGRMMELLGAVLLSKADAENLFITGMFSLLDRLLGVSMADALAQINLPEAVEEALIDGTGLYYPFLVLTKSCETVIAADVSHLDGLGISTTHINQAHFEALRWAQRLAS